MHILLLLVPDSIILIVIPLNALGTEQEAMIRSLSPSANPIFVHRKNISSEKLLHAIQRGEFTHIIIRGPTTVECNACGTSKAKHKIRRVPGEIEEEQGVRLAIDFHDFETSSISGFKCLMLVTDRYSGVLWDYYLTDRKQETILHALQHLFKYLDRQFGIRRGRLSVTMRY